MFEKINIKIKASKIAKNLDIKFNYKDFEIRGVAPIDKIKDHHIAFFTDTINKKFKLTEEKNFDLRKLSKFKNILIITDLKNSKKIKCKKLISKNPRFDFQKTMNNFFVKKKKNKIHSSSIIENKKNLGINVGVGANTFIEKNVKIGKNSTILNNVVITGKVSIGSNCVIKSNTTIGSEGFGFAYDKKKYVHFPHIGGVKIGNRVWIGSNVSIEKGSLEDTTIDDDVLIDDLVQIGHNVRINDRTQITAGCILSGKCRIGSDCWIAPNASIDNNVLIGNNSIVGMGSVVRKNVNKREMVAGVPAKVIKKIK